MPSLFTINGYKIYFWSNENGESIHVHASKGRPYANAPKFWILSDGTVLPADNYDIKNNDLRKIVDGIICNEFMIRNAWLKVFGSITFYR